MSSVDTRIVDMQFNNKQFEEGVGSSIQSLDALKKSLNLEKSAKSLEDLQKIGNRFSLEGIANGVERIAQRFTMLGQIAEETRDRIANAVVSLGKTLLSAVTIDPAKTGLREYETQIGSIQTILSNTRSKGTMLEDVNAALDELNQYSDKTIYNFTQMAKNIGTFTAAGIDLKTSTSAIKGIANLAAVSGSTAEQASVAMYQLSQALASGTVRLMDWNSVVNAGMGGEVFKNALMETARVHGINIDAMIKKEGSFRETLQKGWLTSAILTETLSKFTGDLNKEQIMAMGYTSKQADEIILLGKDASDAATKVKTFTQLISTLKEALGSGWTQSWENIIGNFEEARDLWTSASDVLSDLIVKNAQARNELLSKWKEQGGRDDLITGLTDSFGGLWDIIKSVEEAFHSVFPKVTVDNLLKASSAVKTFGENFKKFASYASSSNIQDVLKGMFSTFKIIGQVFSFIGKVTGEFLSTLKPLGDALLTIGAALGRSVTGFDEWLKKSKTLDGWLKNVHENLKPFAELVKAASEALLNFFGLGSNAAKLGAAVSPVQKFIDAMKKLFKNTIDTSKISAKLKEIIPSKTSGSVDDAENVAEKLMGLVKQVGATGIVGLIGTLLLGTSAAKASKAIGTVVKGITDTLDALQKKLGTKLNIFQIAGSLLVMSAAIAIIAASLYQLATLDAAALARGGAALIGIITTVVGLGIAMKKVGKFDVKPSGMFTLALGMILLASSLKILASMTGPELAQGVLGMASVLMMLYGLAYYMQKNKINPTVPAGLFGFAVSLVVLCSTIKMLGGMDPWKMVQGLSGVAAIVGMLFSLALLMKRTEVSLTLTKGLVWFALGIRLLCSSVQSLADMNPWKMLQGLSGIAAVIGMLYVMAFLMKKNEVSMTMPAGLIGFAIGLMLLCGTVKILGDMDPIKLVQGLLGMAAVIMMLVGLATSMQTLQGVNAKPIGILGLAVGLILLCETVKTLGNMKPEAMTQGLIGMASVLTMLIVLATYMKDLQGINAKPAGILGLAVGLILIATSVKMLGEMQPDGLTRGLMGMGVVLVMMIGLMSEMKSAQLSTVQIAGFIMFSIGLTLLANALKTIGSMSIDQLIVGLTGMSTIIMLIITLAELMKRFTLTTVDIAGIMGMAMAMEALGRTVVMLGGLTPDRMAYAIAGFAGIISIFALITRVMKTIDIRAALSGLIMLTGVAVAVWIFALAMSQIQNIDSKAILATTVGLAAVFVGFAALGAVAQFATAGIFIAVGAIAALIVAMLAIAAMVVGLLHNEKIREFANNGARFFGEIIGNFIGAMEAARAQAFAAGMAGYEKVAGNVTAYAEAMGKVVTAIESINISEDWADKAQLIIDTGNQVNDFIDKIPGPKDDDGNMKSWGETNSGKLASFYSSVSDFVKSMAAYISGVNSLDAGLNTKNFSKNSESILAAANALNDFMSNLPAPTWEDKAKEWTADSNSKMADFGSSIRKFVRAMSGYVDSVNQIGKGANGKGKFDTKGFNSKSKALVDAADSLNNFLKNLPEPTWDDKTKEWRSSTSTKMRDFRNVVTEFPRSMEDYVAAIESVGLSVSGGKNKLSVKNFNTISKALLDAATGLNGFLSGLPEPTWNDQTQSWNSTSASSKMAGFDTTVTGFGNSMRSYVKAVMGAGLSNKGSKGTDSAPPTYKVSDFKTISDALISAATGLNSFLSGLPEAKWDDPTKTWLPGSTGSGMDQFTTAVPAFKQAMMDYVEAVMGTGLSEKGSNATRNSPTTYKLSDFKAISDALVTAATGLNGFLNGLPAPTYNADTMSWSHPMGNLGTFKVMVPMFINAMQGYVKTVLDTPFGTEDETEKNPTGYFAEKSAALVNAAIAINGFLQGLPPARWKQGSTGTWVKENNEDMDVFTEIVPRFAYCMRDYVRIINSIKFGTGEGDDSPADVTAWGEKSTALIEAAKGINAFLVGLPQATWHDPTGTWIANSAGSDMATFESVVPKFAQCMRGYVNAINSINFGVSSDGSSKTRGTSDDVGMFEDKSDALVSAAKGINGFLKDLIPCTWKQEGVLGDWINAGQTDLKNFGSLVKRFALYMASYVGTVSGISFGKAEAGDDTVSDFTRKSTALIEAAKSVNAFLLGLNGPATDVNMDGVTEWNAAFDKSGAASDFGEALQTFADNMNTFSTKLSGIDATGLDINTTNATKAADAVVAFLSSESLKSIETNRNGLFTWFVGDTKANTFFTVLENLATALSKANEAFTNSSKFTFNAVPVKAALTKIAEFINGLNDPNSGYYIDMGWIAVQQQNGFSAVQTVISSLSEMAQAVVDYNKKVSGANVNTKDIAAFALGIGTLMQGLSAIKNGNLDKETIKKALQDAIDALTEVITANSDIKIDPSLFLNGLNAETISENITAAADTIISSLASATTNINNQVTAFNNAGASISTALATGIGSTVDTSGVTAMMGQLVNAADGYSDDFYRIGKYITLGLANGIKNSEAVKKVCDAAAAAVKAAIKAAEDAGKVQSPSRVFMQIGKYLVMGLGIGMDRNSRIAAKSGSSMVNSVLDATQKPLSLLSDLFGTDMQTDPVIRPVVDMSNVSSSARAINGMLSGRNTISVDSVTSRKLASSISTSAANKNQNGSNSEVNKTIDNTRTISFAGANFNFKDNLDIRAFKLEMEALDRDDQRAHGSVY